MYWFKNNGYTLSGTVLMIKKFLSDILSWIYLHSQLVHTSILYTPVKPTMQFREHTGYKHNW